MKSVFRLTLFVRVPHLLFVFVRSSLGWWTMQLGGELDFLGSLLRGWAAHVPALLLPGLLQRARVFQPAHELN